MSARNALAIYDRLLREPDGAEWIRDPLEALTAWATPQAAHFEQWFLLAWDRQRAEEQSQLVEIADRARRHQFLSALELGGRPQALAWLLAAAPEQLSPELKLQRQDLLLRFPEFERARQQARPLRDAFTKLIGGNETERRRTHDELVSQLAQHTAAEQRALRELALRREPAGIVYPPIRATPEVQRALPDKHAILAYFTAQGRTFGFLITRQKYQVWEVGPQAKISEGVAGVLKSWYLVNAQRALSAAEATDQRWKRRAGVLLPYLTAGAQTDFPASLSLEEITIVPDGALWYLPFEALECGSGAKAQPLISVAKLRYTPTVGLAVDRIDDAQPVDRTVALFGRLASRDDEALMAETLTEFERIAPGAVGWRRPISEASAVAATVAGRVIVLDSLPLEGKDAFGWSPLGLNHGETETTVLDWLRLPWPAPREVLLPSFHTAAETALQHDSVAPDGSELFLATTALIGAGARTIVLARWRTGGATVADELREFVQELPFSTPAEAWQRSLLLCMRNPLDPARERRLNWKSREPPPRAEHPFYWAAPLLIHCGIPASQAPEVDPFAAPGAPPAE
ncbi:MAG: CHAT domain-containing protein [Planctomycetaceae bacterium]|nr:CHAT domain-containing protein [Planctomycetaceae bacterium]